MKKIISMLTLAAFAVCACELEQKPELSLESGNYVMGADEALTVKVVTDIAPAADLTVDFTVKGLTAADPEPEAPADPEPEAPANPGDSSKPNAGTGVEGVALVAGIAVLATGAIVVAKKRS